MLPSAALYLRVLQSFGHSTNPLCNINICFVFIRILTHRSTISRQADETSELGLIPPCSIAEKDRNDSCLICFVAFEGTCHLDIIVIIGIKKIWAYKHQDDTGSV